VIAKVTKEGEVRIQLEDQQSYNAEFLQALSRGIAANVLRLMGAPIQ
jgi:DNA-dependent RNA polymerase auxiliary subunit epsilon